MLQCRIVVVLSVVVALLAAIISGLLHVRQCRTVEVVSSTSPEPMPNSSLPPSLCCPVNFPLISSSCSNRTSSCSLAYDGEPAWAGLNTRGFVLQRGFLDRHDVDTLMTLLHDLEPGEAAYADERDVPVEDIAAPLRAKIEMMAQNASAATGLGAILLEAASFFVVDPNDRRKNQHRLHQDHESFYWGERHDHYLNLYLVVEKELMEDANLDIIPFDVLRECSPEFLKLIEGGGAARYMHRHHAMRHFRAAPRTAETIRVDDNHGCRVAVDFSVESLACAPTLVRGDLLVLRGDVIHRTGAFSSRRVALSVRMRDPSSTVRADHLLFGGLVKARALVENVERHSRLLGYLAAHRLKEISWAQIRGSDFLQFNRCKNIFTAGCLRHAYALMLSWYFKQHLLCRAWLLETFAYFFPAY